MSKIQLQAYSLVVLMALSVIVTKAGRVAIKESPPKTQFELIPMDIGAWTGVRAEFDETTKEALPTASLLLRYYAHEDFPYTSLAIVYGTDIGDFHQPEVCLQGQGYKAISKRIVTVKPTHGNPFDAVALITEGPDGQTAFLFWFTSEDKTFTSLGNYQMKILKNRLMRQRIKPSAMIRLSAKIDSSIDKSINQLAAFAGDFAPYLMKQFKAGAAVK